MRTPSAPPPLSPTAWAIDDEVIRLREWGTDTAHLLAAEVRAPLTVGSAPTSSIRLQDPARKIAPKHARLERTRGRWILVDAGSEHGLSVDGTPCTRAELRPGLVISLGGAVTLIAESPRLLALRAALARILGFGPARRAAVDAALRQIRDHDLHRVPLALYGGPTEHALIPIAEELHRLTLTERRPFVVYNPRWSSSAAKGEPLVLNDVAKALLAAGDGTLCVEHGTLTQRQLIALYAAVLSQRSRTHLVLCGSGPAAAPDLPTPRIAIPPLGARRADLRRLIDEYLHEATELLYATGSVALSAADRAWLGTSASGSLPELRTTVHRLAALREAGTINAASSLLGISHVALAKWLDARGFARTVITRPERRARPRRTRSR